MPNELTPEVRAAIATLREAMKASTYGDDLCTAIRVELLRDRCTHCFGPSTRGNYCCCTRDD